MILKVLDLFSGIGGFSLGLERTGGFRTVAFCESNDYARAVLAKHWPDVPRYSDIRELRYSDLTRDGISHPDVLCGGFPCQDISVAGRNAGIGGSRSGLWSEYARLIDEIRPNFVIIENVSVLRSRGLDQVLGQLAALGYDAEWHCIPASTVGAPHQRDRVWVVAYTNKTRRPWLGPPQPKEWRDNPVSVGPSETMAHAYLPRLAFGESLQSYSRKEQSSVIGSDWWAFEPNICRVAHGVPSRVDRLTCLGNAIVPQIATLIGYAIMEQATPDGRSASTLIAGRYQVLASLVGGTYFVTDLQQEPDLVVRIGGKIRRFESQEEAAQWINQEIAAMPEMEPEVLRPAKDVVPPKTAKAATQARRSGGVGERTKELIRQGLDNEGVVAALKKEFPNNANSIGNVRWYRNALKKEGVPTQPRTLQELGVSSPAKPRAPRATNTATAKAGRSPAPAAPRIVKLLSDEGRAAVKHITSLTGNGQSSAPLYTATDSLEQIGRTLQALGSTLVKLEADQRRSKTKNEAMLKNLRAMLAEGS